ncbi:hypothetical protein G647_09537 [Cladophialophora carrionii CBS 160.54]|uniref:Uncharacterized protein n=1 Tax=Cladophialophora carrionii CBS 160.54 TaxID=1279043 RepID=V9DN13_9EURO|nr:uncharacterized protein G647_09537 [Cladophialophora carrionii CBS 160.54]ETI27347.1 hypothetical protein G647_09537 [Cladophialophora carrionii CBS 160.54]
MRQRADSHLVLGGSLSFLRHICLPLANVVGQKSQHDKPTTTQPVRLILCWIIDSWNRCCKVDIPREGYLQLPAGAHYP